MKRLLPMLAVLCLVAACGQQQPTADAPITWMEAKPNPVVSDLRIAVVDRPAPDRVRLEARWSESAIDGMCRVDLGLPGGVLIVEGPEQIDLDPEGDVGTATWILEFPRDGRELDAVVRYCVRTEDGMRAAQCAVRITRTEPGS